MKLTPPQEAELEIRYRYATTTCLIPISMRRGRGVLCRSLWRLGLLAPDFSLTPAGLAEGEARWGDIAVPCSGVVICEDGYVRPTQFYSLAEGLDPGGAA